VPGISKIPVLGKLFESKNVIHSNSELMVIITPEVVRPIPAGQQTPDLPFTPSFVKERESQPDVSHPGVDQTGPVPIHPPVESLPVELLRPKPNQSSAPPPAFQMIPIAPQEPPPPVNPGLAKSSPGGAN
jgi:pilus assembly protein CpaC